MPSEIGKGRDEFRLAVTTTVIWVAGLTLVSILGSLMLGIWLDKLFDSKPLLTVIFVIGSIPVTLFFTFRIVKKATLRLQSPSMKIVTKEDSISGKD